MVYNPFLVLVVNHTVSLSLTMGLKRHYLCFWVPKESIGLEHQKSEQWGIIILWVSNITPIAFSLLRQRARTFDLVPHQNVGHRGGGPNFRVFQFSKTFVKILGMVLLNIYLPLPTLASQTTNWSRLSIVHSGK